MTFDVADLPAVADLLGAHQSRQVSPETRARLARQGFEARTVGAAFAGSGDRSAAG